MNILATLTKRQREVFDLVVVGISNEMAGKSLGISTKTVETHRAAINKKLCVHNTSELILWAASRGVLLSVMAEAEGRGLLDRRFVSAFGER